jgi:hypothetical protein
MGGTGRNAVADVAALDAVGQGSLDESAALIPHLWTLRDGNVGNSPSHVGTNLFSVCRFNLWMCAQQLGRPVW